MSQYPSPYMPPNVPPSYGSPPNLLAPAKRASIMMFVLGPLLLVCGGCVLSIPALLKMVPPESARPMLDQLQSNHISESMLVPIVIVMGILIILPGIALIVLGFFVRKGGAVPAVLSMILVGFILLYNAGSLVVAMLHLTDANGASSACVDLVTLGIFGTLFLWLFQAARASSSIKLAQQQYQAQYWQYQQNMQAYMGYGQQQQQMQTPPTGYPPQGQGQGYAHAPQQQPPNANPPENPGTPPSQA